eukprot:7865714-Pyramimonas_sp.AAC.1
MTTTTPERRATPRGRHDARALGPHGGLPWGQCGAGAPRANGRGRQRASRFEEAFGPGTVAKSIRDQNTASEAPQGGSGDRFCADFVDFENGMHAE